MALLGLTRRAARWLVVVGLAGGAAGCFSGDAFGVCTRDAHCGGDRCVEGRCVAVVTPDAAAGADAAADDAGPGPMSDAAAPAGDFDLQDDCRGVDFDGAVVGRSFYCPDRVVVIRNLITADPDGLKPKFFELTARRIEIVGKLDAHGAGYRGGGGGGGGGGGSQGGRSAAGGAGGRVGNQDLGDGRALAGGPGADGAATPGAGGLGGRGGGEYTPASGTGGPAGETAGAAGGPGADGVQFDATADRSVWQPVLCTRNARPGAGGGGGGGGAGAAAPGCETGPGGAGGGAGTPGGGAVLLHASEAIVIDGPLDVSGGDRQMGASGAQMPGGPCGADANCVSDCSQVDRAGVGGQGGSSANSGHLGGTGHTTRDGLSAGGEGGDGGFGSGGYILLEAPEIHWNAEAALNLSGGGGNGNPGVLVVVGHETGPQVPNRATAAGFLCDPVEYAAANP